MCVCVTVWLKGNLPLNRVCCSSCCCCCCSCSPRRAMPSTSSLMSRGCVHMATTHNEQSWSLTHATFTYSRPHPCPLTPVSLFSYTGPTSLPPFTSPYLGPPHRNTQANALASPGANYPLMSESLPIRSLRNIPVTTTSKIFPKVQWYKCEAYCNTIGGAYCETNGRSTDNIWILTA